MEAEVLSLETVLGDVTENIRRHEATAAHNREQIATSEATIRHQRSRWQDLEEEVADIAANWLPWDCATAICGNSSKRHGRTGRRRGAAWRRRSTVGRGSRRPVGIVIADRGLAAQIATCRAASIERMRASGALASEIGTLENQISAARAAQDRNQRG